MKSNRFLLTSLSAIALVALLSGCGKTTSPTSVTTVDPPVDASPPAAPTALRVVDNGTGVPALCWNASPSGNVSVYEVYAYVPDPSRDEAYQKIGDASPAINALSLPMAYRHGMQYFKVQAVNPAGYHSPFTATLQVILPGGTGTTSGSGGDGPPRRPTEG